MNDLTIGIIQWVVEKALKVAAAKSQSSELLASNIVFILYIALTLKIRNSCFLAAFLFIEVLSYFVLPNDVGQINLFSFYIFLYVVCYWISVYCKLNLNSLRACAIMVALQLVMLTDAILYPDIETFLYSYYEYFFVSIHLYFISTLDKWALSWSGMVNGISSFFNRVRYNYNFTLLLL